MARERWDKRKAFIVAAIGSAIGLGNVWRFPYVAYSNGGGAFFIPFVIAILTAGVPLVALEYYLGIRSQKGPSEAYGFFRKRTNFIGWFSLGVSTMITIYYAVIMGWAWYYLYNSFGVQWAGNEKDFFYNGMLGLTSGINVMGNIQWPIVLGSFLTWVAIFFIIFKGVKVVGKIVNWTVGLPWVILLILIIRGVTLKGAAGGLDYYLKPDFALLLNPDVWLAAYGQVFFSLSLGFGIMIAYASYLPKDSDINTNAWIVTFSDCSTSFFSGFAVFSILGYLAFSTNQPIEEVAKAGPGLAFVVYPTAISALPGGIVSQSIFAVAFFFMLLTLGIDSAFSLVEAVVTGLKDSFSFNREKTCFWVCVAGFFIGLIYTTGMGLYWLDVVDHWMNWGLVIVGFMEAVFISWFYDPKKVIKDMDSTSEIKFGHYWVFCVKYITPAILLITIVSSIYNEIKTPYEGYPTWALISGGWFLLITLLFFAFIMQSRNELFSKLHCSKRKACKIAGGVLAYAGLILTFYLFYIKPDNSLPFIFLVVSSIIGLVAYNLKNIQISLAEEQ